MSEQPPISPVGAPTPPTQPASGLAIAALIVGILSIVLFCIPYVAIPGAIVAIVLGAMARVRARRGEAGGRGMATAGLVCGIVSIVLTILMIAAGGLWMMHALREARKPAHEGMEQASQPVEPISEEPDVPQTWLDVRPSDRAV